MKGLARNKVRVYYCTYSSEKVLTEGEYLTGERCVLYSPPVELYANVSPATGNTSVEQFGNSVQYDKVIVIDDMRCAIDEHSVLFVDKLPVFDDDGNPLFDYVVKKVAKSLNSISVAIAKVEVS